MSSSRILAAMQALTVYLLVAVGALATSACFYDHRMTQAIMERRRRAKEAEGAKIRSASTSVAPKTGLKSGRLHFHVSRDYRQQHSEWRAPLVSLVEAVNAITGPNFSVRFEVASIVEWDPSCAPDQLQTCLDELEKVERGEDGDWIVGVLGAMPSFTASFEHLGMANVPGRRFPILRDVSDLAERTAIDRAFASHTSARRDEIYKRRKAHKRLAVFLHEWGHSMGALHVDSDESLLNPSYDDRMESFDGANYGLIEAGLRDRFRYAGKHDELIAYLQGTAAASLEPDARESLLERLQGATQAPAATLAVRPAAASTESAPTREEPSTKHAFVVQGNEEELLANVDPATRAAYRDAVKLTLAKDMFGALKLMEPVAEKYPQNYAVQHLACGLAMQIGYQAMASKACPRVPTLASGSTHEQN